MPEGLVRHLPGACGESTRVGRVVGRGGVCVRSLGTVLRLLISC